MRTPRRRRTCTALAVLAAAALLAGCSGSSPGTAVAPVSPTPIVVPSSSSSRPSSSPSGALPAEAAATQGGKYYALFLAVARTGTDDSIAAARARAKTLGYEGGDGEIGCTPGAREQLKLPPTGDYIGYSIFFDTREQAARVAAAYGSGVVGIAYITAGCLD